MPTLILILAFLPVQQQNYNQERTLRDQILYDTARLDSLVAAFGEMNRNGSQGVNIVALKVAVIENNIQDLRREVEQLRQVLWAMISVAITQTIAIIWFLMRRQGTSQ